MKREGATKKPIKGKYEENPRIFPTEAFKLFQNA